MRAGLWLFLIAACGSRPRSAPRAIDEELEARDPIVAPASHPTGVAPGVPTVVAAPGKGLRAGTIARDRLVSVLDAGPAAFLRRLEVSPQLAGDRFVGWQLVQLLDGGGPLHDVDLAPGDVLLSINGKPVARPEQLQSLWDSLRSANELTAQMWRGSARLELHFVIDPPVR
jgi:hypothetical protein